MEAVTWVGLIALVGQIVAVLKAITSRDRNVAVTQLMVWVVAVGVVAVAGEAQITQDIEVFGSTLGSLDFWSVVLGGLMGGSTISQVYNFKKAIDSSDSAKEPTLLHG